MGTQSPPKNLTQKARLNGVEVRTPLAFDKRHRVLFPGSRKANGGSFGGATVLLAEVPAEALSVVRMDEAGDYGLYI